LAATSLFELLEASKGLYVDVVMREIERYFMGDFEVFDCVGFGWNKFE
jgi:hypothetical protein